MPQIIPLSTLMLACAWYKESNPPPPPSPPGVGCVSFGGQLHKVGELDLKAGIVNAQVHHLQLGRCGPQCHTWAASLVQIKVPI